MNKKVAAPVQKTEINGRGDRCADYVTPLYPLKLALTSPTGGGRSVGIVRSRTKATEFIFCVLLELPFVKNRTDSKKLQSPAGYETMFLQCRNTVLSCFFPLTNLPLRPRSRSAEAV